MSEQSEAARMNGTVDRLVLCPSCGGGDSEEDLIVEHDEQMHRCRLSCVCGVCGPWSEEQSCDEAWRLWREMPRAENDQVEFQEGSEAE